MSGPRVLLIDTDTASDDAVALIMALRSTAVRVAAITVVAGNVPVEIGTRNALFVTELCDATSVPVFSGAAAPLHRPLETADWFHGADGLGDHGYAPGPACRAEALPAAEAIVRTVRSHPGIEIVTLGPLTNLATALALDSGIAKMISRCVVMGGAPCCVGNVTPAAEFNIWVDPEAAQQVFHAGLALEMVGWQLSRHEAVLGAADIADLRGLGTPLAEFALRSNSTAARAYELQTGEIGIALPDPVAMAIALEPALCTESSAHAVEIETMSDLTRGMTVVDRLGVSGDARNRGVWATNRDTRQAGQPWQQRPPVSVCWQLDIAGWKRALRRALA